MNFQKFESLISKPRISRYLAAASNDQQKAQELYLANLKVAQAFHPLLGLIEIILRNRIDVVFTSYFNNSNWIQSEVNGFMSHVSLTKYDRNTRAQVPDQWLKQEVIKAQRKIRSSNSLVTVGKVIAEQHFGFWTELFETKYYRLLQGKPIQIFNGLPANYGRSEVARDLNSVRKFRNRINHNEHICLNDQNNLDFITAKDVYTTIKNILKWIDPDLMDMVSGIDEVISSITKAEEVLS